jgi:hypothetical protein
MTAAPWLNAIPEMTEPLGRFWKQPAYIRYALMDEKHVLLDTGQIYELHKYDSSYPSGTYPGKCWLRSHGETTWLVWYGEIRGNKIDIHSREVLVC